MPRAKRRVKKRIKVANNDGENEEHGVPDPKSAEFIYDDVDKFHKNREKILLEKSAVSSDEESNEDEEVEEVLGLDMDSDDEDDNDGMVKYYHENEEENVSDNDEDDEMSDESDRDKGIPSEKAWGSKKKIYYDVDDKENKDIDSEEEELLDKEEEEEALAMQERMAEKMDEQDFDMEDFSLPSEITSEKKKSKDNNQTEQERIIKDLSKLNKEDKLKLLAKDSPELFELVDDFKEKLTDVINFFQPLVKLARAGKINNQKVVEYLEIKHQLTMNYLVNISFYLLLKAHQTSVKNHPVIKRLVQYRELLDKMKPLDIQLESDLKKLLKLQHNGNMDLSDGRNKPEQKNEKPRKNVMFAKLEIQLQSPETCSNNTIKGSSKKRKITKEVDPLSYYESVKEMKKKKKEERKNAHILSQETIVGDTEETEVDGKRSITYQISKNKGLTPKRKKELRNPRVKHKKKYIKAKAKRKSQVLPIAKELVRYGGEITGIRTHFTRGVKIK